MRIKILNPAEYGFMMEGGEIYTAKFTSTGKMLIEVNGMLIDLLRVRVRYQLINKGRWLKWSKLLHSHKY